MVLPEHFRPNIMLELMKSARAFSLIFYFVCASVRGEEKFEAGSGDVGVFIIRQAVAFGGSPAATNGFAPIKTEWRYSEDAHGTIIQMPKSVHHQIEALLKQAFGSPRFGPSSATDGGKLAAYRLTPKGGGIQVTYDQKNTQIIIRGPKNLEETL
jgi:hypothetical protein